MNALYYRGRCPHDGLVLSITVESKRPLPDKMPPTFHLLECHLCGNDVPVEQVDEVQS